MNRIICGSLLLVLAATSGCSVKVQTVLHDEDAAAAVVSNVLATAFYRHNPGSVYDAAAPQFRSIGSRTAFAGMIQKLQLDYSPTNFVITDFSTWGPQEIIGIYATSETSRGNMHYRCMLAGSKGKGYVVTEFNFAPTPPKKTGMNVPFKNPKRL